MIKNMIPFYEATDKMMVKSEGSYLFDEEGCKYIDFEAGVWCVNIGHSNREIVKRISDQAEDSIHHGYHFRNKLAEDLSVKLQQLVGFENGASVFLSSGSEAVNLAITLAQHDTKKKKILKIDNSYLSAFGYGKIATDNEFLVNVKYNDLKGIDAIDFSDISAFVIEVGGASAGIVRFPDKEFIEKLTKRCKEHGCLLIAEEVTTGMGRLGKWFGFQNYDYIPDMVVAGKALGNGYPISGVIIDSELLDRFCQHPFRYAQSHQNDPLGCGIALETIAYIENNDLISHSVVMSKHFEDQLKQIQQQHPGKVKEIRVQGLMLAVEFLHGINGEAIAGKLFDRGYVVGFKLNTLRFMPPLTITKEDINFLISELNSLLQN
jgi:acetylornithine aminotransferase